MTKTLRAGSLFSGYEGLGMGVSVALARFGVKLVSAGHITSPDIDLSRTDQLKIAGNGVVPQQADAAVTLLLTRAPEALASLLA